MQNQKGDKFFQITSLLNFKQHLSFILTSIPYEGFEKRDANSSKACYKWFSNWGHLHFREWWKSVQDPEEKKLFVASLRPAAFVGFVGKVKGRVKENCRIWRDLSLLWGEAAARRRKKCVTDNERRKCKKVLLSFSPKTVFPKWHFVTFWKRWKDLQNYKLKSDVILESTTRATHCLEKSPATWKWFRRKAWSLEREREREWESEREREKGNFLPLRRAWTGLSRVLIVNLVEAVRLTKEASFGKTGRELRVEERKRERVVEGESGCVCECVCVQLKIMLENE